MTLICYGSNEASLLNFLRVVYKNEKQVAELDAVQQSRQLAIIKIPGHSKASTLKAKVNHLGDATAK